MRKPCTERSELVVCDHQGLWNNKEFVFRTNALGHAATVALLGAAVIFFQLSLPRGTDRIAERLVGLTLLILGVYVLGSLFVGNSAPRSRFQLMTGALRWVHWKMKSSWHNHDIPAPGQNSFNYDAKSVVVVGIVHGLGAETP